MTVSGDGALTRADQVWLGPVSTCAHCQASATGCDKSIVASHGDGDALWVGAHDQRFVGQLHLIGHHGPLTFSCGEERRQSGPVQRDVTEQVKRSREQKYAEECDEGVQQDLVREKREESPPNDSISPPRYF